MKIHGWSRIINTHSHTHTHTYKVWRLCGNQHRNTCQDLLGFLQGDATLVLHFLFLPAYPRVALRNRHLGEKKKVCGMHRYLDSVRINIHGIRQEVPSRSNRWRFMVCCVGHWLPYRYIWYIVGDGKLTKKKGKRNMRVGMTVVEWTMGNPFQNILLTLYMILVPF